MPLFSWKCCGDTPRAGRYGGGGEVTSDVSDIMLRGRRPRATPGEDMVEVSSPRAVGEASVSAFALPFFFASGRLSGVGVVGINGSDSARVGRT
jgi:hypothetical protein